MANIDGLKHLKSTGADCVSFRDVTFGLDMLADDLEEIIKVLEIPFVEEYIPIMAEESGYEDIYKFAFDQIRYLVRIHEKILQMAHFGIVEEYDFLLSDIRHGWKIYEDFLFHSAIWKG